LAVEEHSIRGIPQLASTAQSIASAGLVLAVEGVEGVGKTTACALVHSAAVAAGLRSALLVDHYERTGRSGPLIAAITEDPVVRLESDLTLFLLYCARLCDKASLARSLAAAHDIVLVDRLDLSLLARAVVGWHLHEPWVRETLAWAKDSLDEVCTVTVCLDATDEVRRQRSAGKPPRRRSFVASLPSAGIRQYLLQEADRRSIRTIETSDQTPEDVLGNIDRVCALGCESLGG